MPSPCATAYTGASKANEKTWAAGTRFLMAARAASTATSAATSSTERGHQTASRTRAALTG